MLKKVLRSSQNRSPSRRYPSTPLQVCLHCKNSIWIGRIATIEFESHVFSNFGRGTRGGRTLRRGVFLPSRCLLDSPFLEPILSTLLGTLLPEIKTHCKKPSKNPS